MATGRNGNEFIENEADFDVSGENKRLMNGDNRDYERGMNRGRGVSDRGLVNGGAKRSVRVSDREPGELSSDSGSDEAINGRGFKIEEVARSRSPDNKRKFSPVVWDRDAMEVADISTSRLPANVVQISTLGNDKVYNAEHSTVNAPVDITSRDSYAGVSSSPVQEENFEYIPKSGKLEEEDYVPAHTIRSSRWANDAISPVDEGEISDVLGNNGTQSRRKTPSGSVSVRSEKQGFSPDIGEFHKEDSDGNRARSPESYENGYRIRSSSSDDYLEKDLARRDEMNLDEDHSSDDNGATVKRAYTDSESDDDSHDTPQRVLPSQRSVNMLQGCRSVDEFERLNKIDEGTYGVVFRAKDKKTEEVVALKKVKMEKEREGFPLTSLREINILLSFDHPSVVDVKEVVVGSNLDSIFMVMEYMEHDLKALMETMKQPFSQSEVKCLMLQLLEGTKYLHDNWVLHRDLKTSNILLNNRGELKICDFGLSRQYGSPLKPYTLLVVTLWYRAPELLLGAKQYSTAIDMWSLGCIMAELLSKQPLFNGKTEFDQLDKIFKTLGTPNESIWPGFSKLPGVKLKFVKQPYNLLRRKFPAASFIGSPVLSDAGFDLLNKLLTYDPEKRITAEAALNHEWFREVPLPKSKDFMPTFPAHHSQDRRTRRVMKSPDPLEEQRIKELKQAKIGTGGLFG